jgi:hypothetical protein
MKPSPAHACQRQRQVEWPAGRTGSSSSPSPPSSHTTPHSLEIDPAADPSGKRRHFACPVGSPWFLRRLDDRLLIDGRLGICDLVFNRPNRVPEEIDRPLFALGKILARFLNLRIVSAWSTNGMRVRAARRAIWN